jgi:chloramphenicol-sensitive protein RarD
VQRSGRLQPGRRLPRDRRALVLLSAAAVLIGVNWGVYIWAVNHNHVVETSLGYFINPLVSVALGVMVLGERLRRRQWAAIALALIGVVELTAAAGRPPWIALALAVSFGCYGLVKKIVGVPAVEGLVVETLALSPVALAFVLVLASTGRSTFVGHGAGHAALLATTGLVTVIPLLAFAGSAPRVPLSLLGVMQYLAPTVQFLIGVLVRHEPLPASTLVGFGFVWVALALFTVDHARSRRRLVTPLVGEVSDPSVISV